MSRGNHTILYTRRIFLCRLTTSLPPIALACLSTRLLRRLCTTRTGTTGKNRQNSLFLSFSHPLTSPIISFFAHCQNKYTYNKISKHLTHEKYWSTLYYRIVFIFFFFLALCFFNKLEQYQHHTRIKWLYVSLNAHRFYFFGLSPEFVP